MALRIASLASGSKGNATLIFSDSTAILVDVGISFKRIKSELARFGLTPSSIDGVVITHEHTDHIAALPKISEHAPVYAHPLTARAIYFRNIDLKNYCEQEFYEGGFEIGDIEVIPFRTPHDAVYPLSYSFRLAQGQQVSVATDIGKPTTGVYNNIKESEVVLLEANYDIEMLKNGSYPEQLKKRITDGLGHLSNDMTASLAEKLIGGATRTLLLGHLSENNNMPVIALKTVEERLNKCGCTDIEVHVASQRSPSDVYEVK